VESTRIFTEDLHKAQKLFRLSHLKVVAAYFSIRTANKSVRTSFFSIAISGPNTYSISLLPGWYETAEASRGPSRPMEDREPLGDPDLEGSQCQAWTVLKIVVPQNSHSDNARHGSAARWLAFSLSYQGSGPQPGKNGAKSDIKPGLEATTDRAIKTIAARSRAKSRSFLLSTSGNKVRE
jgi:hypothetical protein